MKDVAQTAGIKSGIKISRSDKETADNDGNQKSLFPWQTTPFAASGEWRN
jgi:hypothetical protein